MLASRVARSELLVVAALGALAVVLGVATVFSPLAAIAVLVGAAFVVAAFRDLAIGVALFTLLIFFERLPGMADSQLTLVKVAGGVLVAAWLLSLAHSWADVPRLLRDRPIVAYAIVGVVAWAFISALWAVDVGIATSTAFRLSQGAILVFVIYTAIREPRHLRWVAWAYVLGASITALVGLAGGSSPEIVDPTEDLNRLTGQIGDPNELAAILLPALWLAGFLAVVSRSTRQRLLLAFCAIVIIVAIFYTESRGGLVGLAASILVAPFLAGRVRPWVISLIFITGAAGIAYYTLVATPDSLARLTEFNPGGSTGRTDLWTVALQISADHPTVGIGAGNFPTVEPSYAIQTNLIRPDLVVDARKIVHNTYLNVLVELGIVGVVALSIVIVSILVLAWQAIAAARRIGEEDVEMLGRGFLIGFLGMLVAFIFISAQYEKQLWLFIGFAAALSGIVARRREALSEPRELPRAPSPRAGSRGSPHAA